MPATRQQAMDNRMDALEKGMETLAAKYENEMVSVKTSIEELKQMVETLLKGKGTAASNPPDHSGTAGNQVSGTHMRSNQVLESGEASTTVAGTAGGRTPDVADLQGYFAIGLGPAKGFSPQNVSHTGLPVSEDAYAAAARVTLPLFDGSDPESWLTRAEQYFYLHNTPDMRKMDVALIAMEGDALPWYQWVRVNSPGLGWNQFKLEMLRMFGPNPLANPFEALVQTQQSGSVSDYVTAFIARLVHVPGLAESYCLGVFLNGLREEIRLKIRSREARTLADTIHLAKEIEIEVNGRWGMQPTTPSPFATTLEKGSVSSTQTLGPHQGSVAGGSSGSPSRTVTPISGGSSQLSPSSVSNSGSITSNSSSTRQMSHKEYLARRAAGSCFRCNERWSPSHRCLDKSLQVIIIDDPDEDLEGAVTEISEHHTKGTTELPVTH